MKFILTIFFGLLTSFSNGQSCKKMYKNELEPKSKLIKCEYNYTIEKLKNDRCILKRYYPENKTIIQLVSFMKDSLKVRHGLYQERWDDGTIVESGMYVDNLKQGQWRKNVDQFGFYKNDLKEGVWKKYYADSITIREQNFLRGKLHGEQKSYDSLGQIILSEYFEYGKLIRSTEDTLKLYEEEMPRFPGCEELGLSRNELKKCSDKKMLEYVYGNVKYPKRSRKLKIQGKVLVQYFIDTDGSVIDVKVLNGVSKDIKKEVKSLIGNMPKWKPGIIDGEPVKVRYTMPIIFKLS